MPNKKAAMKSLRKDKKRRFRNISAISELRTLTKAVRALIADKKQPEAESSLRTLESKFSKAARTNIVKKNAASRTISRLRSQLAKVAKKA